MLETTPPPSDTAFRGEIRVASRIIDYLSSGLYHTPAACLKELINNSYDAGATRVDVFVKPDADRIIIEDNGEGMNKDEFIRHFSRISESHKRDEGDKTEYNRPKIGKIGIGFIAANEICRVMEIYSTKAGNTDLLHVSINFEELRKTPEERRKGEDFAKADYEGEILVAEKDAHYTQIFLTSFRSSSVESFTPVAQELDDQHDNAKYSLSSSSSSSPQNPKHVVRTLYGLKSQKVFDVLKNAPINSWKDFDWYSETMLQIALNIPVKYYPGWIASQHLEKVADLEKDIGALNFQVLYDGSELYKPIVFASQDEGASLLSRFEFDGKHVSAKGYFYAQHGTIKPNDLQGLLVRIRNAAVGEYDHSFWGFSPSDNSIIQRWISAEVWADDRLEAAMNIDRRTLRASHPAYVELRSAVHQHLGSVLYQARTKIYETGNAERKNRRTEEAITSVVALQELVISSFPTEVAVNVNRILEKSIARPASLKILQRKLSLTEVYEMIVVCAREVLTPKQTASLLENLMEYVEL